MVAAKLLQSCPTLCDPINGSPPGSSVPGLLQARVLEWVAISFSNACMHAKSLQSCSTLCDPMDSSPPGFSVTKVLAEKSADSEITTWSGHATVHGRANAVWHQCLLPCFFLFLQKGVDRPLTLATCELRNFLFCRCDTRADIHLVFAR